MRRHGPEFDPNCQITLRKLGLAGAAALSGGVGLPEIDTVKAGSLADSPGCTNPNGFSMVNLALRTLSIKTARHQTEWIEAGPADGPLVMLLHGWPGLGIVWRAQLEQFSKAGWRCVAPDMRGYGGSSAPTELSAYQLQEIVADMIELHDALGAAPALWIGQDWGSPVAGALASQHPDRCRALVIISIPYLPRAFAVANLVPLVDRNIYPADSYPVGQWDYYVYYQESFEQAACDYEVDVATTLAFLYRRGSSGSIGKPAPTATVRVKGGRFGDAHRAPVTPRDSTMLSQRDFDTLVSAFRTSGFRAPDAWYLNDAANIAYCSGAPDDGRLKQPVLFLGGAWDGICDAVHGRLAEPMRAHCPNLTEITIDGGHWLMLERPVEVNDAITKWLVSEKLS